jgi:hypothetical protein
MTEYGRPLYDFAYIHEIDERLKELAEPEDWNYIQSEMERSNPILYYYFHYTFQRVKEQNKITILPDGSFCCFNTGLATKHQEPIYALFTENKRAESEPWRFVKSARKGEYELSKFPTLPEMASYFDDPSCLVFDSRLEFRINIEHIITENRDRFPEPFKNMNDYALQVVVKGAIDNTIERVKRNYKIAVPQFYLNSVQILLPICLMSPTKADLALVVQKHEGHYRGSTCLTLDMAYNNARQLAKPDKEWLQP